MMQENNLMFFFDVIRQMRLPTRMESADRDLLFQADLGLRKQLGVSEGAFEDWNRRARDLIKRNVVYRITDEFFCKYVAFFPEQDVEPVPKVVLIGPYVSEEVDRVWLERFCQRTGMSREWIPFLESYFQRIVFLRDESLLFAAITALGNRLWGEDGFTTESIVSGVPENWIPLETIPEQGRTEVVEDIQRVEARYNSENRLIEAVAQGQSRKAELMLARTPQTSLEQRTPEKIRNTKNYTIILNTLLRKAAEQGGVHPLYIDRLSSEFARRIEKLTRQDDVSVLWQEMAHRYCLLVRKHSLKMYSPLIQKVVSRVEFDLAGDLSLKANAQALNVNASYLSTLFKKELGVTLTEYVNRKRVEYAIFLLNTTKLSISAVGQRCGIQDDNYFTKIFKKYVGKSPKQFRQENFLFPRKKPQTEQGPGHNPEAPEDGDQRGASSLGE